jgi:DNA-directed RNA polymerase
VATLGTKLIEILEHCDMIQKYIVGHSYKDKQYYLRVVNDKLGYRGKPAEIMALPSKLPRLIKPKPYGKDKLGGYCLNDVKFKEDLFITKAGYGENSELSNDNKIYDMINQMSNIGFKINKPLLDFVSDSQYGLLIDPNIKHKYEDVEKKTLRQQAAYKAHVSSVLLQETILGIAQFFSNFDVFYFPIRLDQRGRLYCSPHFFNYQSNELSKALILFETPGVIKRDDLSSINYLKTYGANCFGGTIGKQSSALKLQ